MTPRQDEDVKCTIVHACGFSSRYGGNFIASLARLRETCRNQGWDFVTVFPEAARNRPWCAKLAAEDWRIRFIPDDASFARSAWAITEILVEENAWLIHTHFSRFDISAWLAARISGLLRSSPIRIVWHVHSDFQIQDTFLRRLKDIIKFRLMGASAHLFLVSDHLKERPLRSGFGPERLHVIPNRIDFSRLDGARSNADPFKVLGVKKDTAVLMFGWHPFVKGVDVALAAFEIVARTRSDLTLLIVGREQTQNEVVKRYPMEKPHWLKLVPPVDNVADYFRCAGIFLSASRREGFPYSVFEAGASGCLLILSDIPALRWMKESVYCWWFRNEDPIDLARMIIACAALKEDKRLKVAQVNSAFIRKHFPVDKWAIEVSEAYGRICAR